MRKMASIEELNFVVTLYSGSAKVHRMELNYMLPNVYEMIENIFLKDGQQFYTDLEVTRGNQVIFRKSLV